METSPAASEYDVYAPPFVPSILRAINADKAHVIITQPKHRIDDWKIVYEKYAKAASPSLSLTEQSYSQYFIQLMKLELAAKKLEREAYTLYQVPLHSFQTPEEALWALSVPGLREDSPHIERGDRLQLRQLWVDGSGALVTVPTHATGQLMGQPEYLPVTYRSWGGVQYDAVVYNVNRAQETVYLRANGLDFLHIGHDIVPMMFNVVFPLRNSFISGQRKALVDIDSYLVSDSWNSHQHASLSSTNNLNVFGESPGAKYATPNAEAPVIGVDVQHHDWIRRMLFPTDADGNVQTQLRKVPHRGLFDPAINYEQAHAINDVSLNAHGILPYLISGPPGTGKTKTLVELAMQLLNTTDVYHMLICAPSEAAADTLALRLKRHLNTKQMLRLNRPGRADNEVPRELLQYCYIKDDMFHLPSFKKMMAFNVVVTSCRDAAMLAEAHLTNNDLWTIQRNTAVAFNPAEPAPTPPLHWSALLIDEAAQATEMDVLPAISVICPPPDYPTPLLQPRFVMTGDEHQLGPRTSSHDPEYSTSLFARLFNRPLYKDHPLSRSKTKPSSGAPVLKRSMLPMTYPSFTLLIRNYRSHPAILSVPSSLFYSDTLIPEALLAKTPLQDSSLWQGRKWPVLFLPNTAPDEIERDNGGWYNVFEAYIACTLAQILVSESAVEQTDICIMSPFAAQVKLIRSIIRSSQYGNGAGLWDVNIGPLEAFQGLEKRVVIICTTRTRERFLKDDKTRGLGVVGEKRKMNVVLTRAKEALFVIGSPAVLMEDEHWTHWLRFCWRNGLVSKNHDQWTGPKLWNSRTPPAAWKGPGDGVGEEKIGVLERALVAKEERATKSGRVLGAAAARDVENGDYEIWTESLRNALDEDKDEEENYPNDSQDDAQDDMQGAVQDHIGKANDDNGAHNHTTTSPASDEKLQRPDRVRDFYGDVYDDKYAGFYESFNVYK